MSDNKEVNIPTEVQTLPRKNNCTTTKSETFVPPNQSIFICTIFCCLAIAIIFTIEFISLPVFNENIGYATNVNISSTPITDAYTSSNMDNYSISAVSKLSIKEWQFSHAYIPPNERLLNPTLLWLLSVLAIWILYISIWLCIKQFYCTSPLPIISEKPQSISYIAKSDDWLVDDIISFTKGYTFTVLACRTLFIIISARISLPIPSFYDLCGYDISQAKCTKTNADVIQEAYSASPNADIGLICGTTAYLSFYIAGKLLQCILQPFLQKCFSNATAKSMAFTGNCNNRDINEFLNSKIPIANDSENERNANVDKHEMYLYFSNFQFLSLYSLVLLVVPFIPLYVAVFLSISLIHDNCARDWDVCLSVVCSTLIAYYIFTFYFENAFECLHVNGNMNVSGLPKQSRVYCIIERRVMQNILRGNDSGLVAGSVEKIVEKGRDELYYLNNNSETVSYR